MLTFFSNSHKPSTEPRQNIWPNACVFALGLLALTSSFGMSLMQLLILLSLPVLAKHAASALPWRSWRWIGIAFFAYFLISVARTFLAHLPISNIDGPLRMVLALSCIGFVWYGKPKIDYLWCGLCLGSIGAAILALVQRLYLGMERAEGFTHHAISFGNLALLMGLLSLAAIPAWRGRKYQFLPAVALLCGLMSSILSGSRGGWLALIMLMPLVWLLRKRPVGKPLALAGLAILPLLGLAYLLPSTGVAERVGAALSDIHLYALTGDATTSVGIRLELWKASWLMFSEHPWLGVGRDHFHIALQELAVRGLLQTSPALTFSSSHNDALFFLATGGLLDFACLLALYAAPFGFFLRVMRTGKAQAPALAGLILVLCFIGFGLTDVMFWLMKPKVFYVMMVGVFCGFCLAEEPFSKG